jgi:RNA polymerase sigma-70 factor (ECF subfamily)
MSEEDRSTEQEQGPQCTDTRWSIILLAGQDSSTKAGRALEELCRAYWMPVYAFVRRKGHSPHDAQDLTQEFFARLLKNKWYQVADPLKGRFRSYLLGGLKHFLSDEWDKQRAAKRGGTERVISLDDMETESLYSQDLASDITPETIFQQRWARTVLSQALTKLTTEYAQAGKADQFDQLKPFLTGEGTEGGYGQLAKSLHMTPGHVGVTMHRLRHRFRELVRTEVAQTLSRPEDLQDELRHLFS